MNQVLANRITALEARVKQLVSKELLDAQLLQSEFQKQSELQMVYGNEMSQLKHKLERKEFTLQLMEVKIYNYEKYLQRRSLSDNEALKLLLKFNDDDEKLEVLKPKQTITNVVDDNLNLRQELKSAVEEINRLEGLNIKLKEKMYSQSQQYRSVVPDQNNYNTLALGGVEELQQNPALSAAYLEQL